MAITDTQKVDFLFKKLGFGITKTDTNANKAAANESISSPLLLRGDKVWQQASSIPSTKPGSSSGVVTVYTGASTVECTADITASTNRTWKTGETDWIPPEFGSTYLVNVYIHTSGDASNAEDISNKVFITGSGNNDEWFFDYQSGVLHFIGTNLPNGVDFTGKSVYVAGARYTGAFGVGSAGGDDADIADFEFSGTTITTATASDNIILDPETGYVSISGTTALKLPVGTTAQQPTAVEGMVRYNSDDDQVEVYNGTSWVGVGSVETVSSDEFDGDGSTTEFTLSRTSTTGAAIVSINGTVQEYTNTFSISGTTLTFNEAPASGDKIQVRNFFSAQDVNVNTSIIKDADNDTKIQVEETADEDVIRFDAGGTEVVTVSSADTKINNSLSLTNIQTISTPGSTSSGSPTALDSGKSVYLFTADPVASPRYYSLPNGGVAGEIIVVAHVSGYAVDSQLDNTNIDWHTNVSLDSTGGGILFLWSGSNWIRLDGFIA